MSATHNFDPAKIMERIVAGVQRGQAVSMVHLQNELKLKLSQNGSGVKYRGGKKRKGAWRTRSSPGEPPAVDTGALRRSVGVKPVRREFGNFYALAMTNLMSYAVHLEFGAPASNMAARPFILPTLQKVLPQVRDIMVRSIQRQLPGVRIT